jgi:hypothetical protein
VFVQGDISASGGREKSISSRKVIDADESFSGSSQKKLETVHEGKNVNEISMITHTHTQSFSVSIFIIVITISFTLFNRRRQKRRKDILFGESSFKERGTR